MYSPAFKICNRIWPDWPDILTNCQKIPEVEYDNCSQEKETKWSHKFRSTPIASPGHSSLVTNLSHTALGRSRVYLDTQACKACPCIVIATSEQRNRTSSSLPKLILIKNCSISPSQPLLTSQGLFPSTKMGTHVRLTTQSNIDG